MSSKRQPRIHFRSLSLPPPPEQLNDKGSVGGDDDDDDPYYSPHFLAALLVVTHVLAPIRKALVHFYMTCHKKNNTSSDDLPLELQTLVAMGRLFQEAVSPPSSSDGGSTIASSNSSISSQEQQNVPVSTARLYPLLVQCLKKHHKTTKPTDATQALQLLLELIQLSTRNLPVTNQLWGALLDQAGLGLIAKQSLVGRHLEPSGDILQRTKKEKCMLWCPLDLPYHDYRDKDNKSLQQLLDEYCSKQPYEGPTTTTNTTKKKKKYYDFDKQPFDFEVRIPSFGGTTSSVSSSTASTEEKWTTTRSFQFTTLTAYLFLGIQRRRKSQQSNDNNGYNEDDSNFNHAELVIPATLNVTKLCDPSEIPKSTSKEYELVGGVLYDEGDYVPVLRDESRAAASKTAAGAAANKTKDSVGEDDDADEDDEAWKLLETEEVIPMSESDVLEFLKGEGEAGDAPCGTMAIYRRKDAACHEEMNQLLSDIIISQVSGTLKSNADFYYEEEIIEDDNDDDDEEEEE